RRYGRADLALAEELARRAALAIDNARLYREAQDANRLKDDFLATLSHELRTPLSAILIWARLLRAGRLDQASQVRALDVIERNTALQARLIEDLLDVSRIITGKLSLEVGPVDMASTVQADSTSTRSHAGLGLGLAIVRHLVELHGGTVEAQSPGEGQGATFIVKLPLLRERYATADAASLGGSARSMFDLSSLAGVDVLLVDDETDTRESTSAVLELCGARVRAVGSAAEAADAIDRQLPDVLVCDIGMP